MLTPFGLLRIMAPAYAAAHWPLRSERVAEILDVILIPASHLIGCLR